MPDRVTTYMILKSYVGIAKEKGYNPLRDPPPIETIEDAIELLKNQRPKTGYRYYDSHGIEHCSVCERVLIFSEAWYCPECGAKLERN